MRKHQTQTGPLPVTGSETRLDWNLTARGCFLVIQFVLYFSLSPLQPLGRFYDYASCSLLATYASFKLFLTICPGVHSMHL